MPAHSPVDVFVTYDGKRAADIPPPRYAVRHLVAAEVSPHPCANNARNLPPPSADRRSACPPPRGSDRPHEIKQAFYFLRCCNVSSLHQHKCIGARLDLTRFSLPLGQGTPMGPKRTIPFQERVWECSFLPLLPSTEMSHHKNGPRPPQQPMRTLWKRFTFL